MSSRKSKSNIKTRARRATSNVFAMFDQAQIQEFKEAFNMIDQDRDGFISKEDLHDTLASLGKNPQDNYLDEMINEATGPINFTMFLTMFGDKLNGTDPESVILNAFACFDQDCLLNTTKTQMDTFYLNKSLHVNSNTNNNNNNNNKINEDKLRDLLLTLGDRFTDEECDQLLRDAPIRDGLFDYIEFTRILKHGRREDDLNQTL